MKEIGYAVYSVQYGVFLGHMMGESIWSNIDSAGQDCAVTFATEELAHQAMRGERNLKDYKLIPVEITEIKGLTKFASMESCKKAYIPAWSTKILTGILINPTKQVTHKIDPKLLDMVTWGKMKLNWGTILDYMVETYVLGKLTLNHQDFYLLQHEDKHYLVELSGVMVNR